MKLAQIFSSNMVFQAKMPVRVFGEGAGTVQIRFFGKTYLKTFTKKQWLMILDAYDYGGPYQMEITINGQSAVLSNIFIGEVMLFAGQSNMQFEIKNEVGSESVKPCKRVRYFHSDNIEGHGVLRSSMGWLEGTDQNVPEFSALAFHVAESLAREKGICVGIISCVQGASVIRSWMSKDILTPDVFIPLEKRHADSTDAAYSLFNQDAACYEKTFLPIAPYAVSRVIWYQGESDTSVEEGQVYLELLKKLVTLWRHDLKNQKLPFVVIQICDFVVREDEGWRSIQQRQLEAEKGIPYVWTVTSSDVCGHTEIHPEDKRGLAEKIRSLLSEVPQ